MYCEKKSNLILKYLQKERILFIQIAKLNAMYNDSKIWITQPKIRYLKVVLLLYVHVYVNEGYSFQIFK